MEDHANDVARQKHKEDDEKKAYAERLVHQLGEKDSELRIL